MFIMQKEDSLAARGKKLQFSQLSKCGKQRSGNGQSSILLIKSQAVDLSIKVSKCEG